MTSQVAAMILIQLAVLAGANEGFQTGSPVMYTVTDMANNTAGGARFEKQIGAHVAKLAMYAATRFTWIVFNQTDDLTERKNVSRIDLFINNGTAALTNGTSIHVDANYIANYTGNLRRQFNGMMYQEVAGIWQWTGNGQAPEGLVSGIAHFVRLQARYGTVEKVRPGEGHRWDQGNGVTARFLIYCNQLNKGFVGELNRKMRYGYTDGYFLDLLGKTIEQLWSNYKDNHGPDSARHHA
ncbi:unnamed protein product [Linum trigynum]|uniref:Uncharacterized protein n=1 Tax=Linum trigynum TaxID=586398 RepID=A0AAV2E192_9ROSI